MDLKILIKRIEITYGLRTTCKWRSKKTKAFANCASTVTKCMQPKRNNKKKLAKLPAQLVWEGDLQVFEIWEVEQCLEADWWCSWQTRQDQERVLWKGLGSGAGGRSAAGWAAVAEAAAPNPASCRPNCSLASTATTRHTNCSKRCYSLSHKTKAIEILLNFKQTNNRCTQIMTTN